MNSSDLEPWQAERVRKAIRTKLEYLSRLQTRMEKVGFLPNDRLFRLVVDAHSSLHALYVELHYLACDKSAGRKPR